MTRRKLLQRTKNAKTEALRTTTLREFEGGWNVIDNDINLSPSYSKIMENVYRKPDGSIGVRWGTRVFGDLELVGDSTNYAVENIATGNASATVTITITDHPFISGVTLTAAGFSGSYNGIAEADLNGNRTITYVDADNFTITAGNAATATGNITGGNETFTHDLSTTTSEIIFTEYFGDYIVAACANGQIYRVDANGDAEIIWSSAIAGKLSGAPSGWSTGLTFASAAVFNRKLVVCNGIDKPLIIDFDRTPSATVGYVEYLYDLGNPFSNTNVPIGRYVLAMSRYTVIAGDPTEPDKIHISSRDTSGTWAGDAGSDGISLSLGKYVSASNQTIRGLARFDDKLFVQFDEAFLIGTLGIYESTTHVPTFNVSISAFGGLAHNALQSLGNDLYACDYAGVPSIARALFTGDFRPERISELIGPAIQQCLSILTVAATEDRVFAIFNRRENQYMLFIPDDPTTPTETKVYAYTQPVKGNKVGTWARFRDWNYRAGCRSTLDRVFLATGAKIHVMGSDIDPIYSDNVALAGAADSGDPIAFTWEFPWADFDDRLAIKALRYVQFDTKGSGNFSFKIFIDNLQTNAAGLETPIIELGFVAQTVAGYGASRYGIAYGGTGRITLLEQLYAIRTKFKIMKMRFSGSTVNELRFVSISLAYLKGSIRR